MLEQQLDSTRLAALQHDAVVAEAMAQCKACR